MQFPQPLTRGRLVRRYKRFFADVALEDDSEVTAHCPNPGAMLGFNTPGLAVWLSRSDDPKRKLAHTLELVQDAGGALVGVNTMHPNRLVAEALAQGRIAELAGYDSHRREVAYGEASRVDFLLEAPGRPRCWVEAKNITFSRSPGLAEFPDCVSARAVRHLAELSAMAAAGERAVVLFVIQRDDCPAFAVARDLDARFAAALAAASAAGVEVIAYGCRMSPQGVSLDRAAAWRR